MASFPLASCSGRGSLQLDVVRPRALTEADITRWRAFQAEDPALQSPFLDPDFARIAGDIAPRAAIGVLHRRGEVEGYLPFQRRRGTLQPLAAPLNDYQGVIAPARTRPSLNGVMHLAGVGGSWVTGWIGPAGHVAGLRPASAAVVDLSAGWNAYLADQTRAHAKFFRDKARIRRRIEAAFSRVDLATDDSGPERLDELIALKRRQYARTGQHDVFHCGWTIDILRALLARPRSGLHARIATLGFDGRLAGYELSLASGATQHFWLPAYDPAAAAYSPGMILSLDTMRTRRAEGVCLFDLGSGPEAYKRYFTNAARPVLTGFAYRSEDRASALMTDRRVGKLRQRWALIEACGDYVSGLAAGARAMLRRAGR